MLTPNLSERDTEIKRNADDAFGSQGSNSRELAWKRNQQYFDEEYLLDDYERSPVSFHDPSKANKGDPDSCSENVPSDDETFADYPLKKTSYCVQKAISALFSKSPHPTAFEMNQLTENYSVRYKTVFETLEKKRNSQNIFCNQGDNCERIREYFRQQHEEPYAYPTIPPDSKQLLEEFIENHILTRKRFEIGYVHVLMEKTNLPFGVVRSSYSKWRKRILSSNIPGYTIERWKYDHRHAILHAKVFTHNSIRKMEEAYLKKKYESENKDWTDEELSRLSDKIGQIPVEKIVAWLQDRNTVALDSFYLDPEPPRTEIHKFQPCSSSRIPLNKLKCLKEVYIKNTRPTKWEFEQIAVNLELEVKTVRSFYQRSHRISKRKEQLEEAKREINKLTTDKIKILKILAADKTKKRAYEHVEWAEKIGISYRSLRVFIDWKKSLKGRHWKYEI